MTCRGYQERDICSYRFEWFCMYTEYDGHDTAPCESRNSTIVIHGPLTKKDIERGQREVDILLWRREFKVVK